MKESDSMEQERAELAAYNPGYCRKEKLFRMYAGCSSEPLRYRDGVVEIEIRLSDTALACNTKKENVIRQLVAKWRGVVPGARKLKAHIYRRGRVGPGFSVPAASFVDKSGKPNEDAVRQLRQLLESLRDDAWVDIKLEERIY